jgi:hypothetical protein
MALSNFSKNDEFELKLSTSFRRFNLKEKNNKGGTVCLEKKVQYKMGATTFSITAKESSFFR